MSSVKSVARSVKMPPAASVSGPKSAKTTAPAKAAIKPAESSHGAEEHLRLDQITISHNDRTEFDKKAIETLAVSIAERGLDNAITVREKHIDPVTGEKTYELIAGERRLRAVRSLQWPMVRVRIIEADDKSADLLRLEENLLREDLNQIERAAGLKRFIEKHGESQSAVGKRFGMTQAQVSNLLRLLTLTPFWQEAVKAGRVAHTIARDVLCPWHHRPHLLDYVAEQMSDDDETFERDVLQSLIHQGIRELTRSCRREQYYEFYTYSDKSCCFKLDDKNRHALDVEDSPAGEPRAWNVKAWAELNAPALKAYKERQKKDKASHGIPTKSKGKPGKDARVEQTCDQRKLASAVDRQLCEKLAAAISPKKHKASIIRVFAFLAASEDMVLATFGDKAYSVGSSGRIRILAEVSDGDLPAFFCDAVCRFLKDSSDWIDTDIIIALAAMLPIDLMHDWTPTDAVLEAYEDSQLIAFAHDFEIDHTQSRLNLILALTKPGVWQAGHVPTEVATLVKVGK